MTELHRFVPVLGEPRYLRDDPHIWSELEHRLGVRFPSDFKDFADAYGPGVIVGHVRLAHPCGPDEFNLESMVRDVSPLMTGYPNERFDYGFYPDHPDGLFAWGDTAEGSTFFFSPAPCDPDQSKVVVYSRVYGSGFRFDGGFTEFLYTLVNWTDGPCPFPGPFEGPSDYRPAFVTPDELEPMFPGM